MTTATAGSMTAEEFWEWVNRPENQGRRWELQDGEVVEMPSPGELHGVICFLIARLLGNFLFQRGRGYLCSNDSGLLVRQNPDTVRGPDLMLFDESRKLEELSPKFATGVPRLVVEVLSPSDQMGKVNRRIAQYLRRGVPLVWLVDPDGRFVTVYRPGQELQVVDEGEELTGGDALPDLRMRVDELFALPGQR